MTNTQASFAPIFCDHVVLQQNKPIRIWGQAPVFSCVLVALYDSQNNLMSQSENCVVSGTESEFLATLPPVKAGGPYELRLFRDNILQSEIHDVMIGEVYLAGGQSNMEFKLIQDADYSPEMSLNSNIRYFQVPQLAFIDDYYESVQKQTHWSLSNDDDFRQISAVGYYFADNLVKKLNVPVGIICCNWGGTSASAWQDKETLCSSDETISYWNEYEAYANSKTIEEHWKDREEYLDYQAKWQPKIDTYYATHPTNGTWDEAIAYAGECKWPGPIGPFHEFRPCGLYETMLKTVIPYSLAGVIYYQGESDDHKPHSYYTLLKNMIALWRKEFLDETLPFCHVLLPMHHYENEPWSDKWCYIRDAQLRLFQDGICDGLAVCIDQGEYNNIHPVHKKEVGKRIALQALCNIYQLITENDANGPIFKSAATTNDQVTICFNYAAKGFLCKSDKIINTSSAKSSICPDVISDTQKDVITNIAEKNNDFYNAFDFMKFINGFELSEDNQTFYPAEVIDISDDTVTIASKKVTSPNHVRYLHTDYSEVTLYGFNRLPVAPFISQPIKHL